MLSSCGYSFGETRRINPAPRGATLAVPVFDNQTDWLGAGSVFSGAAREEFARRGGFTLSGPGADYSIHGKILDIASPLGSFRTRGSGYRALSYDLRAKVEVSLVDGTGRVLKEAVLEDVATLTGGPYPERTLGDRRLVLERLARRMMRRAVDELTEAF